MRSTRGSLILLGFVSFAIGCGSDGGDAATTATSATATSSATTTSSSDAATTSSSASTTTSGVGGSGGAGGAGGSGGASEGGGGSGGVLDPWADPLESLKAVDLGAVPTSTSFFFPIPDRTLGLTVQCEGPVPGSAIGVYRLRPPVGASVVFDYSMTGHQTDVFVGYEVITVADPQSDSADAWPVVPGDWKLELGTDQPNGGTSATTVWARRTNDGLFHGGVIDVNVILASASTTQAYMNQVLDALFPYAGLDLGTVTFLAGDPSNAVVDDYSEYRALLLSTAGIGTAPAVNLFVVDDFSSAGFGNAIGVAGGVPGSPMRHGTGQSGLAYTPSGDPAYDATVLMHEMGHVGGLFHTTEFQITETDPLSDTAECDSATIQSNPAACPDKDNVMFPMAYGATTFTNAQLLVLQGSALYRGILDAGGAPSGPLPLPAGPPSRFVPLAPSDAPAVTHAMPRSPDALEQALARLGCGADVRGPALAIARDRTAPLTRQRDGSAFLRLEAIALDHHLPLLLRSRALGLVADAAAPAERPAAFALTLSLAEPTGPAAAEPRLRAAALQLAAAGLASATPAQRARFDRAREAARRDPSPTVRGALP